MTRGSSKRKSYRSRTRSRSRHGEKGKDDSMRRKRTKSVERLLRKSNHHHRVSRREEIPLSRTCSHRTEMTGQGRRRYESAGNSSRLRMLDRSPVRAKKSVRKVIMDERDFSRRLSSKTENIPRKMSMKDRLGVRVKDRLGVRKQEAKGIELSNMDTSLGKYGPEAIVKASVTSSKSVQSLVNHTGRVVNILNDSFGLLQFCLTDTTSSYCLFDTYDLYLGGGRTAAMSNLTLENILDLNMAL